MIDTYVEAAVQVVMVAEVNERAQDAQTAPDEREAMALPIGRCCLARIMQTHR